MEQLNDDIYNIHNRALANLTIKRWSHDSINKGEITYVLSNERYYIKKSNGRLTRLSQPYRSEKQLKHLNTIDKNEFKKYISLNINKPKKLLQNRNILINNHTEKQQTLIKDLKPSNTILISEWVDEYGKKQKTSMCSKTVKVGEVVNIIKIEQIDPYSPLSIEKLNKNNKATREQTYGVVAETKDSKPKRWYTMKQLGHIKNKNYEPVEV